MTGKALDALGENNKALKDATKEFGDGLSEAAGDLVVSQIAAERMRTEAFPAQMNALRDALTGESEEGRVIVMVGDAAAAAAAATGGMLPGAVPRPG